MAVAKGTEQLGVGINSEIVKELRVFAESRGETIRAIVEMALRRHMANPPPLPEPLPPPPLPPLTPLPPVTTAESSRITAKKLAVKKGKR
ncbi:MAG TPA: hypothetical protein VG122_22165 [Gemmata sp.]|jgi:hypothetical protein|nr:hypothetical protein [Gemmata sp.]